MSMMGTVLHCPFCGHYVGCAKGKALFVVAIERAPDEGDGFDYRRCLNLRCKAWLKYEIVAVYDTPILVVDRAA
jgi:hypothetical protein